MEEFKTVFSPLKIGHLVLKNRITLAPMFLCYGNPDGSVSEKMKDFYARRAKAGVSLLVVEASAIDVKGMGSPRTIRVDDDAYTPGLTRLARQLKRLEDLQFFRSIMVEDIHSNPLLRLQ